jgi:putative tryptophan/tyrosine transport system substrate-binding protein
MRRRTFIALAGSVSAWPVVARAQTPARLGYLGAGTADSYYMRRLLAGLTQGLTENGMIEGRDYLLETRFVGDYERFPTLARELQQAKVRIIIARPRRRSPTRALFWPTVSLLESSIAGRLITLSGFSTRARTPPTCPSNSRRASG